MKQHHTPPTFPALKPIPLDVYTQDYLAYVVERFIFARLAILLLLSISGVTLHKAQGAHFVVVGAVIASTLISYGLLKRGRGQASAVWLTADSWLWITLTALTTPAIESTIIGAYIIAIFITGILLGWRWMAIITAVCVVMSYLILQTDQTAYIPWEVPVSPVTGWVVQVSFYIATAILFYFAYISLQGIITTLEKHRSLAEIQNRQLRESGEQLTRIVENAPIVVFMMTEGMIALAEKIPGRPMLHKARERQMYTLVPYLSQPEIRQQLNQLLPGEAYSQQLQTRSGFFEVRYLRVWRDGKPTEAIMGVATDITAQKRAEEKNSLYIKQLQSLSEITLILTGKFSHDYLFNLVVRTIIEAIPHAEAASLFLYDASQGTLVFQAGAGWENTYPAIHQITFATHQSVAGHVYTQNLPHIVYDTRKDKYFTPLELEPLDAIKSCVVVPLTFNERVIGILSADNFSRVGAFDEDALELMVSFAAATASAVEALRLYEEARQARDHAQELARQIIRTQENEQRRIGLELHDDLGQAMYHCLLDLKRVEDSLSSNQQTAKEIIQSLRGQADRLLNELRYIVRRLRPVILDEMGLRYALDDCAKWYIQRDKLRIIVQMEGDETGLSEDGRTAIYRWVQEALANASRYAQAHQINVQVDLTGKEGLVIIEDDGVGFEVPPNLRFPDKAPGGNGLSGMQQRASLLGGTFQVTSQVGAGTCVKITFPLAKGDPYDHKTYFSGG